MAALASVAPIVARTSAALAGRKVATSATNGTAGKISARATWMPGSTTPAYLDGSMAGAYSRPLLSST
jgi:transcription elongation factor